MIALKGSDGAETKLAYDYLVLAIGSTYASPIKPINAEPTLKARQATLGAAAAKLKTANKVKADFKKQHPVPYSSCEGFDCTTCAAHRPPEGSDSYSDS